MTGFRHEAYVRNLPGQPFEHEHLILRGLDPSRRLSPFVCVGLTAVFSFSLPCEARRSWREFRSRVQCVARHAGNGLVLPLLFSVEDLPNQWLRYMSLIRILSSLASRTSCLLASSSLRSNIPVIPIRILSAIYLRNVSLLPPPFPPTPSFSSPGPLLTSLIC